MAGPSDPRGARAALARAAVAAALAALASCSDDEGAGEPRAEAARPPGFWFEARERPDVDVGAIGYAAGTREADPAEATGVRILVEGAAMPGATLYCSGHAPEARTIDLRGETLCRWSVDYESLAGVPPMRHPTQRAWRRVRALPDGGLLALHEGLALLRLDAQSELVWSVGLNAHHDFDVDAEGRVHVLVRRAVEHGALDATRTVVDDGVAVLAPDGALVTRVSILDAFLASPWAHVVREAMTVPVGRTIDLAAESEVGESARDLLHVNSYNLLASVPEGMPEAFRPGRALLCVRELDALALLDLEAARIVWYLAGGFDAPHDPEIDSEGRLWLFDNGMRRGWSRALRIDPHTGRELRQWPASPDPGFFSEVCGSLQVLANGNLLLAESTAGRAFEVDPAGRVVWSFATPHRVDAPVGPLVACLFEVERLP